MTGQGRTVQLGQFEDHNARSIADRLDAEGILWWEKVPGRFTRLLSAGDWGVRLFVEESRLDEAVRIAQDALDG